MSDERPEKMPTNVQLATVILGALCRTYRISDDEAMLWLAWFVDAADAAAREKPKGD